MFYRRFYQLAAILLLLIALVFVNGCGKKQHVSFTYSFAISPKKGEVLKNVTIYLPFPTKNGKPMMEIYRSLERHYEKYHLDDTPGLTLSMIDTKYGPMLKVQVAKLSQGVGLNGGYSLEGSSQTIMETKHNSLNPRANIHKLTLDRSEHQYDSRIFAEFENAKSFGLSLNYRITVLSPSLLPIDYVPEDKYEVFLGWEKPPEQQGSLVKYFDKKGWIKVPVSDLGFDKE